MTISLVINSKCNQKCEYCFAYDTLHDNNTIMTPYTCDEILKFHSKSNNPLIKRQVNIIGGEPTLHPQFEDILEIVDRYSKKNFFEYVLFTNGTNLCKYDNIVFKNNIHGLINVNHPDIVGFKNFNNTCEAIQRYNKQFNIGINIYPDLKDYSFIFDIANKNNIQMIRASVACPDGKYKDYQDKREEYFKICIDTFISFCEEAIRRKIIINMDCCSIPLCYFNHKQIEIVKHACNSVYNYPDYMRVCCPNIEIHPDLTVSHCFMKAEGIHMHDFENIDLLCEHVVKNFVEPKRIKMKYGRCSNCHLLENKICQGGCLRFAQKGENNE